MALKELGVRWIPGKGYHFPQGPYVEYTGTLDGVDTEKLKKLKRRPFSLTSNGFDFLMSIEAPIAVISICGTTQSGKSSLLNQTILELDNCFLEKFDE